MTYYYKQINEDGEVVRLFTYDFKPKIKRSDFVEIDAEEYNRLFEELRPTEAPES